MEKTNNGSKLNRTLGLPMLTFYGLGMILGAGIYSIIGKAAAETGDALWMAFVMAAIAALFTGLSYAELSTMFPKAGAEYVYLSQAFSRHKWLGATAGVAMAFAGAATATSVAMAFTGYLNQFVTAPSFIVAAAVLSVFTAVAITGIRISGWTNIVFTLIEMTGLIIIIYLGATSEKFAEALTAPPGSGVLSGAALIIFAFFGFENIVNLAEEAKTPEKSLSKAILLSLLIASILYFLVSLAAVAALSVEKLAASEAALMTVAQVHSKQLGSVLGGIALFSTANTVLISMVGASRILYGMAEGGILHQKISEVRQRHKTPWVASLVVFVVSLLLLPLGKVEVVASVSSLATMVVFVLVNGAVIALRLKQPETARPFRVPISIGRVPLPAVLGLLISLLFIFQFGAVVYLVGGLFLGIVALIFIKSGQMSGKT